MICGIVIQPVLCVYCEKQWGRWGSFITINVSIILTVIVCIRMTLNAPLLQVVSVDVKNKVVHFKDGLKMEYNNLLIATGSR